MGPTLTAALAATDHETRQRHLCDAYETVAVLQNETGLADHVDPGRRQFYTRPYLVLRAGRFARALAAGLTDPRLADRPLPGAVDQWADNTDLLAAAPPAALRAATEALAGPW